jgi:hypothetical protein
MMTVAIQERSFPMIEIENVDDYLPHMHFLKKAVRYHLTVLKHLTNLDLDSASEALSYTSLGENVIRTGHTFFSQPTNPLPLSKQLSMMIASARKQLTVSTICALALKTFLFVNFCIDKFVPNAEISSYTSLKKVIIHLSAIYEASLTILKTTASAEHTDHYYGSLLSAAANIVDAVAQLGMLYFTYRLSAALHLCLATVSFCGSVIDLSLNQTSNKLFDSKSSDLC